MTHYIRVTSTFPWFLVSWARNSETFKANSREKQLVVDQNHWGNLIIYLSRYNDYINNFRDNYNDNNHSSIAMMMIMMIMMIMIIILKNEKKKKLLKEESERHPSIVLEYFFWMGFGISSWIYLCMLSFFYPSWSVTRLNHSRKLDHCSAGFSLTFEVEGHCLVNRRVP